MKSTTNRPLGQVTTSPLVQLAHPPASDRWSAHLSGLLPGVAAGPALLQLAHPLAVDHFDPFTFLRNSSTATLASADM
jgi:hypothetical protein